MSSSFPIEIQSCGLATGEQIGKGAESGRDETVSAASVQSSQAWPQTDPAWSGGWCGTKFLMDDDWQFGSLSGGVGGGVGGGAEQDRQRWGA